MVLDVARVSATKESSVVDFGSRLAVAMGHRLGSWRSLRHQAGDDGELNAARDCSESGSRVKLGSRTTILFFVPKEQFEAIVNKLLQMGGVCCQF